MELMESTENAAKLMGASSVLAAITSLTGYVTADAIIPTIGAVVAIGMGLAGAAKAFTDMTHKWEVERKDKYIRSLEVKIDRMEEHAEQEKQRLEENAEKERSKLEHRVDMIQIILRGWKDAAIARGVTVDEAALIAAEAKVEKPNAAH
jgi:hypothetical protein